MTNIEQLTLINKMVDAGRLFSDGHTIFEPSAYPEEAQHLTRVHTSDGSPKGTISTSDGPVASLPGIYHLDFLYWLAGAVEAARPVSKLGRGSQAGELCKVIRDRREALTRQVEAAQGDQAGGGSLTQPAAPAYNRENGGE